MTKELAKLLVLAQASSDAGKQKYKLFNVLKDIKLAKKVVGFDYTLKDQCILNALNILTRHPQKDIHFFVEKDHQKKAKYIVYFDFMMKGQKSQISFHTFNNNVKRFFKGSKKSHTEWKKELNAQKVAYLLAIEYGLIKSVSWEDVLAEKCWRIRDYRFLH